MLTRDDSNTWRAVPRGNTNHPADRDLCAYIAQPCDMQNGFGEIAKFGGTCQGACTEKRELGTKLHNKTRLYCALRICGGGQVSKLPKSH